MANSVLYGVAQQKDLAAHLVAQNIALSIDQDIVVAAVIETVTQHNAEVNALRDIFAKPTTDYLLGYQGVIQNDLQEGDEYQKPEPVKGVSVTPVSFPLRIAMTAWGANYTTLQQMTVQDFSDKTEQMLQGDVNWNRKWTLATLLFNGRDASGNTTGTLPFVWNDPKYGALNVYGLANGDATTYNKFSSQFGATDNHYAAQNGAISDTAGQNPFPTIESALTEHPENTGPFVAFIDPALATSVRALASFVPVYLNLAQPGPGSTVSTFEGSLASIPSVTLPPNAQQIGVIGRLHIVTWPSIPTNIIIARAFGSPPPLLFRQYPFANLQGFSPVGFQDAIAGSSFSNRFPYFDQNWYRAGGFGGYNRVGAYVHQVGTSTTYTMPINYAKMFGRTS